MKPFKDFKENHLSKHQFSTLENLEKGGNTYDHLWNHQFSGVPCEFFRGFWPSVDSGCELETAQRWQHGAAPGSWNGSYRGAENEEKTDDTIAVGSWYPPKKVTYPLNMDGWKSTFLLGRPIFRRYVTFREGTCMVRDWKWLPYTCAINLSQKNPMVGTWQRWFLNMFDDSSIFMHVPCSRLLVNVSANEQRFPPPSSHQLRRLYSCFWHQGGSGSDGLDGVTPQKHKQDFHSEVSKADALDLDLNSRIKELTMGFGEW